MLILAALGLWTLPQTQPDSSRQARELIEKLPSEKIEEREEATQKLKKLGKAAIPELEKVPNGGDQEVSGRIGYLLRVIRIAESLPSNLRTLVPGVEDRLANGNPNTWTKVFLEAYQQEKKDRNRGFGLTSADFNSLAEGALHGAQTSKEKEAVCHIVCGWGLRQAEPELLPLLKDPEWSVRASALGALGIVGSPDSIPHILEALKDKHASVRTTAIRSLGFLKAREAIPDIIRIFRSKETMVAAEAGRALINLHAEEAIPVLLEMLDSGEWNVRSLAETLAGEWGLKEAVPRLLRLAEKREEDQSTALRALGRMGAKEATPLALKVLVEEDEELRGTAIKVLGELGSRESGKEILRVLEANESEAAIEAAGVLRLKEARPILVKYLLHRTLKFEAAPSLCYLGVMDGVPSILAEAKDHDLIPLNALLAPELWNRLETQRIDRDLWGTVWEGFGEVAKEAGLTVDVEGMSPPQPPFTLQRICRISNCGRRMSLLNFVRRLQGEAGVEVVLEGDKIRIMSYDKALAFWKSWWSKQQKK